MILALVLIIMVPGSLVFHFVNPWHASALASNWLEMDRTLNITFAVTGPFFVVLNLLLVWLLLRFKHKPGQRAAYQPENHRLERWPIGDTGLGIIGLLAPGLLVYADASWSRCWASNGDGATASRAPTASLAAAMRAS